MSKYDVKSQADIDPHLNNPISLEEMRAVLPLEEVMKIDAHQNDPNLDLAIRIGSPLPDEFTTKNPDLVDIVLNTIVTLTPEARKHVKQDELTQQILADKTPHSEGIKAQALRARRTVVALLMAEQTLPGVIRPPEPTEEITAARLNAVRPSQ